MPYHLATIEVLVDADDLLDAADAVSEALRPMLREFDPASSLIDWRYASGSIVPERHSGEGFEYA